MEDQVTFKYLCIGAKELVACEDVAAYTQQNDLMILKRNDGSIIWLNMCQVLWAKMEPA